MSWCGHSGPSSAGILDTLHGPPHTCSLQSLAAHKPPREPPPHGWNCNGSSQCGNPNNPCHTHSDAPGNSCLRRRWSETDKQKTEGSTFWVRQHKPPWPHSIHGNVSCTWKCKVTQKLHHNSTCNLFTQIHVEVFPHVHKKQSHVGSVHWSIQLRMIYTSLLSLGFPSQVFPVIPWTEAVTWFLWIMFSLPLSYSLSAQDGQTLGWSKASWHLRPCASCCHLFLLPCSWIDLAHHPPLLQLPLLLKGKGAVPVREWMEVGAPANLLPEATVSTSLIDGASPGQTLIHSFLGRRIIGCSYGHWEVVHYMAK